MVERAARGTLSDEIRYRVLRYLEDHPRASQRDLAREMGVSVGKANYCLRALIDRGWVKVDNFRRSDAKVAYLYLVTPRGLQEKIKAAGAFLERKRAEYDAAEREIRRLTIEMAEFAPEWKTRP